MPEQIQTNSVQPNLLMAELQLAGKNTGKSSFEVFTAGKENKVSNYELSRDDNYFGLKLQPIAYSNLQKCQYAYFLKGHDKIWHYSSQDPKVSYSNIQPGDYTLLVKWTNGEGTWTNEMPALKLSVKQYFWLRWPAFLVYSALLALAGAMYYRYRRNKFLLKQSLILEHTLREKDEEIHQEQLNFFTNIAHELQTPLTLILGSIDRYLHKKNQAEKEKTGNHFLAIVKQEASRLHYLVHQLLEFRKAESGHLSNHLISLNVSNLLLNISALFHPLCEQKDLDYRVEIEPDIILATDKDKIEKIIFNLLSNAFKHSASNQHIVFTVNKSKSNGLLEMVIANSGVQLSDQDLHRLFDRFFVMDGSQQSKISSGIGLAFTRQLVTLLNGTITVNCENSWIYFRVSLPIEIAVGMPAVSLSENRDKTEKPSYILESITSEQLDLKTTDNVFELNKKSMLSSFEENHKKNVLVVEDDQSIRFVLRDILSEHYVVYEAGNGNEALKVIKRMIPDIIVSDIMMPDMDGLELCNIIKTTPETCHIPFVLLTAKSSVEQKIEGYEVGADAYIPKPFHADHLMVRIKRLIEYQEKLHRLFSQEQVPHKIAEAGLKDTDKNFIESVIKVIEDNLDNEGLDAAFIENKMLLSKMQIYRKLKSLTNMTPGELIRNVRLKQAANLLKSTNLTVSEIFYRTGFNNQSYFYREFKKMYQTSPNDFRAQQKVPAV
jgi:signal transduction histidine kinase/DNA-binding NarL/FixJ family response regulator